MGRPRTKSVVHFREYFQGEMYVHHHTMNDDQEDDWMALGWKSNSNKTYSEGYSTTDDEEEDDELNSSRRRTCSHERHISFDDEVNVVEIPSRDCYDEEHKRQMWYSAAEFDQMRIMD